jgi:cytochrome c biogenesis protein CcdA
MLEYITNTLQKVASEPLGLVFALILGTVSAATSACCTLPAMGVLVGYSGARVEASRKDVYRSAILFTIGTVISLMIIGGIAGIRRPGCAERAGPILEGLCGYRSDNLRVGCP